MTRKLCKRCKRLEQIVIDIHWMARRYATGRQTYAPSMFNDAMREAVNLGLKLREDSIENPPTIWACPGDIS